MKSCQPLVTPLRTADPNQPCGRIQTIHSRVCNDEPILSPLRLLTSAALGAMGGPLVGWWLVGLINNIQFSLVGWLVVQNGTIVTNAGMYSSDSSTRLIWFSSTKWCHERLGNFSYLSTRTFFSAPHSVWYAFSLSNSVCPGLSHLVGFSCVRARTPSLLLVLCCAGFISGSLSSESFAPCLFGGTSI